MDQIELFKPMTPFSRGRVAISLQALTVWFNQEKEVHIKSAVAVYYDKLLNLYKEDEKFYGPTAQSTDIGSDLQSDKTSI